MCGRYRLSRRKQIIEEHFDTSIAMCIRDRDGEKEKEENALRNLRLTEYITRTFLDEVLKNDKQAKLHDDSETTVKHFGSGN